MSLTKKEKIGYGFGDLSANIIVATISFYLFYFTSAYMLFNTVWTVVYVPYNALTANMTRDYDERTALNGIRIS